MYKFVFSFSVFSVLRVWNWRVSASHMTPALCKCFFKIWGELGKKVFFTLHYRPVWDVLLLHVTDKFCGKHKHFHLSNILYLPNSLWTMQWCTYDWLCILGKNPSGCRLFSFGYQQSLFLALCLLFLCFALRCLAWRSSTNDWHSGITALIHGKASFFGRILCASYQLGGDVRGFGEALALLLSEVVEQSHIGGGWWWEESGWKPSCLPHSATIVSLPLYPDLLSALSYMNRITEFGLSQSSSSRWTSYTLTMANWFPLLALQTSHHEIKGVQYCIGICTIAHIFGINWDMRMI